MESSGSTIEHSLGGSEHKDGGSSPEDQSMSFSPNNTLDNEGYQSMVPNNEVGTQFAKPRVIQLQKGYNVKVIYDPETEVITNDQVTVNVGNDNYDENVSNYQACIICGDRGSGYHYSVLSCEGCKGFFKRTVQKDLRYTCKGSGMCVINKTTRNNCQFCRYQKCLQFGMKREAVREDRSPGGKHRTKKPRLDNVIEVEGGVELAQKKLQQEHSEIVHILLESDAEKVPKPEGPGGLPFSEMSIDELMSFGYTELKFIIDWAKKVPNFRTFSMDDQMALLKSAFMELNVLRLAFRSIQFNDSLMFAEGIIIPRTVCETMGWGQELVHATLDFAVRLKELQVDHVEFALISSIILTYPDAIGLVDKFKVLTIQTKFLDVLRHYVCMKFPNDRGRFGKLLLRLPTLRTLSAKAAERFLSLTLEGVLPLNELVQEMMC